MKVKSESEAAQSCPTLSDPMDCSPPGSSAHGIFQARVLERGAIAFSTCQLQVNGNLVLPLSSFYEVSNFDDDKYSSLMEHLYKWFSLIKDVICSIPTVLTRGGTSTAKTLLRIIVERQCFQRARMQVEMNLGLVLKQHP